MRDDYQESQGSACEADVEAVVNVGSEEASAECEDLWLSLASLVHDYRAGH